MIIPYRTKAHQSTWVLGRVQIDTHATQNSTAQCMIQLLDPCERI